MTLNSSLVTLGPVELAHMPTICSKLEVVGHSCGSKLGGLGHLGSKLGVLGSILAPSWMSWGPSWLQVGGLGSHLGFKLAPSWSLGRHCGSKWEV